MNDKQRESGAKFNEFVQDYIDGYEFRGDGDYSPNEFERMLITDCVAGLLYELGVGPEIPQQAAGAEPVICVEVVDGEVFSIRHAGSGVARLGDGIHDLYPQPPKTAPHTNHPGPSTTACDDQEAPDE